jgi:D-alanyl-lipoteichoic acid acyltransferase DltB (MBOAT superfamily)
LYIPIGGSKGTKLFQIRNVMIIFLVSGFWHGASWTYVAWGLINALYFIPLLVLNKNRSNIDAFTISFNFTSLKIVLNIILTFAITCLAWIFFRAKTIQEAFSYIQRMVTDWDFSKQYFNIERYNYEILVMILLFVMVEWNNRYKIEPLSGKYSELKVGLSILVIIALGIFTDYKNFIYFQF